MYGKTFSENDSIHSHSEESIAMMDELFKSIETAHLGLNSGTPVTLIMGVKSDSVRFAFQHIRESIEAYRDLCDELEDDKDEIRHEYEEKVVQFFNRFMNADLADETSYRAKLNADLADEREKSTQLEQRIKVLTAERDLAKKLAKQKCREVGELTKELEYKHEQAEFWRKKCIDFLRSEDTDSVDTNNPCNFCGNCRYYAQMGKDDGDFEGICTQHYIKRVDPDDASCEHFKTTYDKPDHEVCDNCDSDCDTCGYYPF